MKTAFRPDIKLNTFCNSKSYTRVREKEFNLFDSRFYQRLFIVLISLTAILIFPESPQILGNICETYNSRKSCIVW